jgi:hypothetical protein
MKNPFFVPSLLPDAKQDQNIKRRSIHKDRRPSPLLESNSLTSSARTTKIKRKIGVKTSTNHRAGWNGQVGVGSTA